MIIMIDKAYSDLEIEELEANQQNLWEKCEQEPKLLFKYKSIALAKDFARIYDCIKLNYLYFPTVEKLNDSLEGIGTKILLKNTEQFESEKKNEYHVLALSENCFSPVMWTHYSSNRSGVCLGFFKGNPLDSTNDSAFRDARRVYYVDKRSAFSSDEEMAVERDLFYKNSDWSYEKEWRIVKKTDENEFRYHESDLACAIFGEKADRVLKECIRTINPKLRFYEVHYDAQHYCLYLSNNTAKLYTIQELYDDIVSKT